MIPEYNNPLISNPLPSIKEPIIESKKPGLRKIEDIFFESLAERSLKKIEQKSNDPIVKDVLKNKAVAMTLLDKSGRIKGKHHPHVQHVKKFNFGANSTASKAIINRLEKISKNETINDQSKEIIREWIENENQCVITGSILDDWSSSEDYLLQIGTSFRKESAKEIIKTTENLQEVEAPEDEINIFSHAIANHLKEMKKGEFFVIPSGSLNHCTRIRIDRNEDGSFEMIHFNTGLGAINKSTANKYGPIDKNTLEEPKFWVHFVQAKMTPKMDKFNQLLRTTCQSDPQPLDKELTKSFQESPSCSFHAPLAEFKYYFISRFDHSDEGYQEYRKIKYLLTSNAIENEAGTMDSALFHNLVSKEKLGRRHMDWLSIIDDLEKYDNLIEAYFKAIIWIEPNSKEKLNQMIQGKSPLKCLSVLNHYLDHQLKNASYEKLEKIRNNQDAKYLVNGVNYLGMRQMMWIEYNRTFLSELIASKKIKEIKNVVESINDTITPKLTDEKIQEPLPLSLDKDFFSFLKQYIKVEQPEIAKKMLKDLFDTGCIDEKTYKLASIDIVLNHRAVEKFFEQESCQRITQTLNELKKDNLISQMHYSEWMIYAETGKFGIDAYVIMAKPDDGKRKVNQLFDKELIDKKRYNELMVNIETNSTSLKEYVKKNISRPEVVIRKVQSLFDNGLIDRETFDNYQLFFVWRGVFNSSESENIIKNMIINRGLLPVQASLIENAALFVKKDIDGIIESVENIFKKILNLTEVTAEKDLLLQTKSKVYQKLLEITVFYPNLFGCIGSLELAYKLGEQDKQSVISHIREHYSNEFYKEIFLTGSIENLQKYKNDLQFSLNDIKSLMQLAFDKRKFVFFKKLIQMEGFQILDELDISEIKKANVDILKYLYNHMADDEGRERMKLQLAKVQKVDKLGEDFKKEIGC